LKAAFHAFGNNQQVAMLTIAYSSTEALEQFAQTNQITWPQATFTGTTTNRTLADYLESVDIWPGHPIFLIDPNVKIIAKGMDGAEIKDALAKVLIK
jgi:hypothetical protein